MGSPPGAVSPQLGPDGATTLDGLVLSLAAEAVDSDGNLAGYHVAWDVDGVAIPELGDAWFVPAERTARGEIWTAAVFAFDTEGLEGPTVTASLTVINAAPTAPGVRIEPTLPVGGVDDLLCVIDPPSSDPDGDVVSFTITWELEGDPWPAPDAPPDGPLAGTTVLPGDTVPAAATSPLQMWQCKVEPNDGLLAGPVGDVTIHLAGHTAPDWSLIDLNPNSQGYLGAVSPRDYLEQVSGWYFVHTT